MPSSKASLHHLAIFSCSVTSCSRMFKSESSLKCHWTSKHLIPEALHPQQQPNADPQDANLDHPYLDDTNTQHPDTLPLPHEKTSNSFNMERHPILDGTPCDATGDDIQPGLPPPPYDDHAQDDYSLF
ncbi:hypothetical protein EI94DRAFT_1698242 [Lactarius quietus]|nr:hypothetical protein EI94DRAFT_1698242 [Lactarius quietus]